MRCFFDSLPYEWWSGTSNGLFLPIYPPRSICVVLGFWWLVDFCNKYVSSLWLMLSSWIIRTLTLPSLLASSVPCVALSHLESGCKLRRCIQTPWYDTLYHTKASLYLPQNSHHTYLLWHLHSHSEIYCHATFHRSVYYDTFHHCHIALHHHVVDIVFVAKPPFIILSYMSLLIHCTSRYTAVGIHIESYFVLSIEL